MHPVLPAEEPIDELQQGDNGPDQRGQPTCIGDKKLPIELVWLLQHLGLARVDGAHTGSQRVEHQPCLDGQLGLASCFQAILALQT